MVVIRAAEAQAQIEPQVTGQVRCRREYRA